MSAGLPSTARPCVLIVTGLFPTPGTYSFSGTFVVQQLQALRQYYRVIALVPYVIRPRVLVRVLFPRCRAKDHGSDVYLLPCLPLTLVLPYAVGRLSGLTSRLPVSPDARSTLSGQLKRYLSTVTIRVAERLHRQYGFALVHGHELFIGDEAATIGRRLGIPSIVTIHGLYDFHASVWGPAAMQAIVENLRRADYLLTVSEIARRTYAPRVNKPIHIISNGYTPARDRSIAPPDVLTFVQGRTVVLYVGFLVSSKRVDLLLEAVRVLRDNLGRQFCLLIVGAGTAQRSLEVLVDTHGLGGQVRFEGEVDPSRMPAYYALADFLVQPSASDSFSMVCLEAMAYGLPIICTANVGMAEYIHDGIEGYVVRADDLEELTDRIRLLLTDERCRQAMGERARRRARDFAWDVKIREVVDFYAQVMDRATPP